MEIYFDDELIDEDYYTGLSTNFALFGDTFYLGSTASNNYNLSIDKEAIKSHPNMVTIKNDGTLIATLVVDKMEENDFEYKYTLTDKMLDLEFKYDASELMSNGGVTLLKIAQDICNKAGIELATMNFRGYNKIINWYDNTRTAREYIGYIAELNGGYAQIGKDGKLYFIKQNEPSVKTINIDDCSDFKIGEKHAITRVVYEQGTLKYEYGNETGNTLYLNSDNVFITEQSEVEEIFDDIKGFEFYSFSTSNCPVDYNIMAGQIITFTDEENNYPVIAGYDELTFNGDWYGGYKLDVATKKQEETQVVDTDEKIRDLKIKVDRESNKITQLTQETSEHEEKLAKQEQDIDSISQSVEHIVNTTNIEKKERILTLNNCAIGMVIELHIYGNNIVFDYLYPADNLYPSDSVYPYGDSRIEVAGFNETSEEAIYYDIYELGVTEVLRRNEEVCDEYVLKDGRAQVIRRVNSDGTTKTEELMEDLGEFSIQLKDIKNVIQIKNYTARIEAKYAVKSTYTDIFATKVEMSASIGIAEQEINLEVNKKVNNEDFTSANIMLKINGDTSEAKINADKIDINGTISANGNFKIGTDGKMECTDAVIKGGDVTIEDDSTSYNASKFKINGSDSKGYLSSLALELYKKDLSKGVALAIDGIQGGNQILAYSTDGNVGIGFGEIWADGNIYGANISSDKRLKKNIVNSNIDAINIVKNMGIKSFDWKRNNRHIKAGFIAQEMEKIDENFVLKQPILDKDGQTIDHKYYMNELPIIATLVKAIQEQQNIIEQLQKEIYKLKEEK